MTAPKNRYQGPWVTPTSKLILPLSASREEWLEARRQGIGGSDAAALVGAGRYKEQTPWFVWRSKVEKLEEEDRLIYRRGHELENIIAKRFEEEHPKHHRTRRAGLHQHRELPFMLASVDRLTSDGGGLEMKTTISQEVRRWRDEFGEEPPEHYVWQCLQYMAVTGRSHWYLAALVTDTWEFIWWTIDWDHERIDLLRVIEEEFWTTHVLAGIEPEYDPETGGLAEAKARWPRVTADVLALETGNGSGARLAEVLDRRRVLKEQEKDIDLELAGLDGELRAIAQGHEQVNLDGRKAFTLKESSTTRLDTTKLRESEPDVYDLYKKTTLGRRLYVAK